MLSRRAIKDANFVAALGIPPDHQQLALSVRNAIADLCRLPRRLLKPDDRLGSLERFIVWQSWDQLQFFLYLDVRTSERFDHRLELPIFGGEMPLGKWIELTVSVLKRSSILG
jgi:hypothetical protein